MRIEFCMALDKCLYQETEYNVRSTYYKGHLLLEIRFLDTIKPIHGFKIIEEYMKEVFEIHLGKVCYLGGILCIEQQKNDMIT